MPSPHRYLQLTQKDLKELLHYHPASGMFTWRVHRSSRAQEGDEAGHIRASDGHRVIVVDGRYYMASRLAWLYMTGRVPEVRIVTRDGDKTNLAWSNLALEQELWRPTPHAAYQRHYRAARKAFEAGQGARNFADTYRDPRDPADPLNVDIYDPELVKGKGLRRFKAREYRKDHTS